MSAELLDRKELGRSYRVVRQLAEGGASLICEAERLRPPRRRVAVKLLHPMLADDPSEVARFQQEAELLGELQHPHVVQVLDVDSTPDGLPYFVMELLQGQTLRQRLDEEQRLTPAVVARVVEQAAGGLQALHDLRAVHRDVNPRNLFLVAEDPVEVKVMDFGLVLSLAEAGSDAEVIGTEGYMSPEQFRGEVNAVGPATDVFALGVVAYEALSGRRPFVADSEEALLHQICHEEPTPLTARVKGLPPAANQVLAKALAKQRDQRYERVEEFAQELAQVLGDATAAPVAAAPAPEPAPAPAVVEPSVTLEDAPADADPFPEPEDLLGGMTLMDASRETLMAAIRELEEAGGEEPKQDAPADDRLAGHTVALPGATDEAPQERAPQDEPAEQPGSGDDRLAGHTVLLPGAADEAQGGDDEGGDEPQAPADDRLAGQTVMLPGANDEGLDSDSGGADDAEGAPDQVDALDPLDPLSGQTLADGDYSLKSALNERDDAPTPPDREADEVKPEKARVFAGEAWSATPAKAKDAPVPKREQHSSTVEHEHMAETMILEGRDRPQERGDPLDEPTAAISKEEARQVPGSRKLVVIAVGMTVAIILLLVVALILK